MKPSEYPLSSEVKPEAGYVSTTMSPAPVVPELSESAPIAAAAPSGDGTSEDGRPPMETQTEMNIQRKSGFLMTAIALALGLAGALPLSGCAAETKPPGCSTDDQVAGGAGDDGTGRQVTGQGRAESDHPEGEEAHDHRRRSAPTSRRR